ncbi:hypothetical protein GJQ54_05220 [Oceanospirillaceae bacterium ASx5O]|nr:hypothetical protein GJQ54_05220 [Oceanospirillaceae bacterium ASx5O]
MANSKKRCKHCRAYFSEWVTYPAGTFCTVEHALAFAQQPAQRKKAYKVKTNELKARIRGNDVAHQQDITQKVFNRMIKLERIAEYRRAGQVPVCISCTKTVVPGREGEFAAGHLKTVGAHDELRFNTLNVELQCNRYCNMGLSGNLYGNRNSHGYIAGLSIRYGDAIAAIRMEHLKKPRANFNRDTADLKTLRKWCNARIRVLEQELSLE